MRKVNENFVYNLQKFKIYFKNLKKICWKYWINLRTICEIFSLLKYLFKFCEYNLKEDLKISAGLFGKVRKILEKLKIN